jgi:hypothetical protein
MCWQGRRKVWSDDPMSFFSKLKIAERLIVKILRRSDALLGGQHRLFVKKSRLLWETKNNDIVLPYSVVSKLHCHLGAEVSSNWYIEDRGSSNGTYIRKRQLEVSK